MDGDVLKDESKHRRGEAKGNAQRPRTLNTRVDAQNEPGPKVTGGTLPYGVGFHETVLYYGLSAFWTPSWGTTHAVHTPLGLGHPRLLRLHITRGPTTMLPH